jgi:hypothetical protein
MIKSFLILVSFSIFLHSSQQIVLVVANNLNTAHAKLEYFEDSKLIGSFDVNIGKKGLGWGLGEIKLKKGKNDPIKHEGDKKAPIGVFKLSTLFGYSKKSNFHMPYLYADKDLICVDDSDSKYYNKIITMPKRKPKSFEFMRRDDNQYKLGVVVQHNQDAKPLKGSCIFLHIQKAKNAGTAGCTSMRYKDLKKLVNWLDEKKDPILIQIPKSSSKEVLRLFKGLKNSKIL